ncbi:tRNA isopentenyltransferase [Phycomyces blakesleeanus]|uniref:tRNA dimethylallyltransferase n=1 Tax=Phycomyces blakesleeanus TaxID=4837 RepID=A0ABR3BDU1_PHYBL
MRKILSVIGTTGVGKSNLAVDLCRTLRGQAINSDAMQVYKGLDIITNKMPLEERHGVTHHLMDFLDPEDEYKVTEFKRDATQCIEKLSNENQLPVLVGGTNYYMQSLLWRNTLIKETNGESDEEEDRSRSRSPSPEIVPELEVLETPELYDRLKQVDPIMATKWHVSDRRKIMRSLQIFHATGKPQSEIIKEQKAQKETHGAQPRFKALVFWLYADPVALYPRLDERVDKMIETGLFEEIKDLRRRVVAGSITLPGQELEKYQRGLWQAIGYKEFDPYFTAVEENTLEEPELKKIKDECTERMKAATRRYARRQVQWIRNKFLPSVFDSKGDVLVYLLDAGDLDAWNTNVQQKAIDVAREDRPMPDPASFGDVAAKMLSKSDAEDTHARVLNWKKHVCPVCITNKGEVAIMNGDLEWEQHKKSRWHRKSSKRKRMEELTANKPPL